MSLLSPCRPSWWQCRVRWGTSGSGCLSCSGLHLPRSCPSVPFPPSHPAHKANSHTVFIAVSHSDETQWRPCCLSTWCLGRPTMDGKTARGASSPAKPALHMPEPLSTTRAAMSSSISERDNQMNKKTYLGSYSHDWLLFPTLQNFRFLCYDTETSAFIQKAMSFNNWVRNAWLTFWNKVECTFTVMRHLEVDVAQTFI